MGFTVVSSCIAGYLMRYKKKAQSVHSVSPTTLRIFRKITKTKLQLHKFYLQNSKLKFCYRVAVLRYRIRELRYRVEGLRYLVTRLRYRLTGCVAE